MRESVEKYLRAKANPVFRKFSRQIITKAIVSIALQGNAQLIASIEQTATMIKMTQAATEQSTASAMDKSIQLIHYNRLPKGEYFTAWEQPELFVQELRDSFVSLR